MTRPAHHVDVATSALPAAIAQPPGGIQTAGFPAHSKFASAWANWLFNHLGDWNRELDQSALRAQDCLSIATPQLLKNSGGGFALPLGEGLANLQPDDGGAYVLLGRRVDLSRAALAEKYPTGWTLPSNTTVYAHAREETDFGGSSTGEILISTNTSEVGYQLIWAGTTDGTNLASQNTLAATSAQWILPLDLTGPLELSGPMTIDDDEDETAFAVSSAAATTAAARITCSAGGTLLALAMGNAAAIGVDAPVGSGAGVGFRSVLTNAAASARGLEVTCNSGTAGQGVRVAHGGSGIAVAIVGSGSGSSLFVNAGSSAATGSQFTGGTSTCVDVTATGNASALVVSGSGSGTAVDVTGGSTAGTTTLRATGNNNTGKAIVAALPNTATSAARGVYSSVGGSAVAAEFIAAANHALVVTGDTTSPTYGAVKVVGSNARPTDQTAGQLTHLTTEAQFAVSAPEDSGEAGPGVGWRGLWSSTGGFALGYYVKSPSQAIVTGAGYQLVASMVSQAGNAPKLAGRKAVMRLSLCTRTDAPTNVEMLLNVKIIDVTNGGATVFVREGDISGTGTTGGYYIPAYPKFRFLAATLNLDFEVTIPAAGNRTWSIYLEAIGGATQITVRDVALSFVGLA